MRNFQLQELFLQEVTHPGKVMQIRRKKCDEAVKVIASLAGGGKGHPRFSGPVRTTLSLRAAENRSARLKSASFETSRSGDRRPYRSKH